MTTCCSSDSTEPLYVGGGRRMRFLFENDEGDADDPTTIVLTLTKPSGDTVVASKGNADPLLEILQDATGDWYYDPTYDEDGEWEWKLATTGPIHEVTKGTFEVLP